MSAAMTTVDLLRHGEPIGGRRFLGAVDDPLSERGWAQMREVAGRRAGDRCAWDAVVSSPLIRCAAFARELAECRGLPLELEPRLTEISFGAWDGRAVAEINIEQPERLGRFWRDPLRHPPPAGEPLAAFRERVLAAWDGLLARYAGRHVLVITHGGAVCMIICHLLEMPLIRLWRLHVPYAGLSRLRLYGAGADPQVLFLSCGPMSDE